MSEIAKNCDIIIKKRTEERLPLIKRKLAVIGEMKRALIQLSDFRDRIQKKDGALAPLTEKAPGVVETISSLNLTPLLGSSGRAEDSGAIFRLEEELKRLEKRFSRNRIQIALIGNARNGKSTFLQSVSGLVDNDVIPTSSYTDCTGAVSIIENCDGPFRMEIEFYSESEFVDYINSCLQQFDLHDLRIKKKEDIRDLIGNNSLKEHHNEDVKNFYKEYIENPDQYLKCIGLAKKEFTEPRKVVEYVAKYKQIHIEERNSCEYEYFREEDDQDIVTLYFNKYVAVKEARIWTKYKFPEAGQIVMLDTVGLGNKNTEDKDKETMYKVLREDTDAAIYNFVVPIGGMSEGPKNEINTIDGVFSNLYALQPENWFIININTYTEASGLFPDHAKFVIYDKLCNTILNKMANSTFGKEGTDKHKALFAKRVSNNNPEEVINEVMIPLLTAISEKVSGLDEIFMTESEEMATEVYNLYGEICNRLTRAFDNIVAQSPSFLSTFNENFNKLPLRIHLDEYVAELRNNKDKVCVEIVNELKPQLTELTSFMPEQEEIATKLRGMDAHHIQNVYFGISDHVTARIISHLKDVSAKAISDVQDSVKIRIARLLHDSGRLRLLNLKTGSLTDDSKAIEWLASLCRERLSGYPELEDAVNAVINFRMNIEGYIYAECIKACEVLQDRSIQFPSDDEPIETKAKFIWNTIMQKVIALRENLRVRFGIKQELRFGADPNVSELAKPSLLIWCLADSFCKQFLYINNGEDLRNFYCEYAPVIWRDEIQLQEDIKEATESAKELMMSLKSHNDRHLF